MMVWFQVLVRFGEVDSWMEDDEKTENREMGIWEREGIVWFDGDDDGKKMTLVLRGSVKRERKMCGQFWGKGIIRDDDEWWLFSLVEFCWLFDFRCL